MANGDNLAIYALKIVLMSCGALFITILLYLSFNPLFTSITTTHLPTLLSSVKGWLTPPFLYFIINAIIITIAATSHRHNNHHVPPKPLPTPPLVVHDHHDDYDDHHFVAPYDDVSVKDVHVEEEGLVEERVVEEVEVVEGQPVPVVEHEVVDDVHEPSTRIPPPSPEILTTEELPDSPRLRHRGPPAIKVRPAQGEKVLRVAKPQQFETLECVWKAITEGKDRENQSARHLKKSDSLENRHRQINLLSNTCPLPPRMKKSGTFKDRTNYSPPPVQSSRLKKEPSLGKDELNRQVEAFINKFNEEMRLQRQQSMEKFMDKISRAA